MDIREDQQVCVAEFLVPDAAEPQAEPEAAEREMAAVEPRPVTPVMPDLSRPRHGFYHTVDSALTDLTRAGIGAERITIRKAGRGYSKGRIVQQRPAPGVPLTGDVAVELTVEGDNAFYYLPTGMHEGGSRREPGADDLVLLFDDPVEKAAYTVRQGGLYFDVRPENRPGCARWIRLFGIDPEDWPRERWYELAVLLPCLNRLAGREAGLRRAPQVLLRLDVYGITRRPRRTPLAPEEQSRLGERASRLGADLVIGDGMDDEAAMDIILGPVTLAVYREYRTEPGERRLRQVLDLLLPYHAVSTIRWLVGDASRAPRLGNEQENSVLGVNAHIGKG